MWQFDPEVWEQFLSDGIYLLHFLIENFGSHHYIIFSMSYKDVSGTKYKQGVLLRIDNYGDEINPPARSSKLTKRSY